jgi:AP-1-like transcription factor
MSVPGSQFYLSPTEQDLLVAALASQPPATPKMTDENESNSKFDKSKTETSPSAQPDRHQSSPDGFLDPSQQMTISPTLHFPSDGSPYLGFDLDADGEDQYEFDGNDQFNGEYPGEDSNNDMHDLHEKRKSIGDQDGDIADGRGKRRESEGITGKKPGRKPLTAEPATVRDSFSPSPQI